MWLTVWEFDYVYFIFSVALLWISVDGFQNDEKIALFEFGNFLLGIYIINSENWCEFLNPILKIYGFPETHGTHAKGATAYDVL